MPREVVLGYRTITVNAMPFDDDMLKSVGFMSQNRNSLTVVDCGRGFENVNTLVHELLHFVYKDNSLHQLSDDKDDAEERVVSIMANGMTEILVRNPDLLEWIRSELR